MTRHLTTAEADTFHNALRRTVTFTYRAGEERKRRENLIANGHREPSTRTDYSTDEFGESK